MKLELSVSEWKELNHQISNPNKLFEMMRIDIRKEVGSYLSGLCGQNYQSN